MGAACRRRGLTTNVWEGILWLLIVGFWLVGLRADPAKRPSRLAAYALNWLLPALALGGCVLQAVRKDYWGVAIFAIGLGFALVNATHLYPSPRRTRLLRGLTVVFALVAATAVWKTFSP